MLSDFIILIYIHIYINITVNVTVRPHPRSGDSQGQETFLALSADKQTRNYYIEWSNHHPFLTTLRSKRLSRRKMKWWAIYTNLTLNAIVKLPHLRSRDIQGLETFLAPSADKSTRFYDTECSTHHPSLSAFKSKGLSRSNMKWWDISTNFPVNAIVRYLIIGAEIGRSSRRF